MNRFQSSALRSERGQTAAEYIGLILIVAVIIVAIVATGVGDTVTRKIICAIKGGDCATTVAVDQRCKLRSTTSTDKLAIGISVEAFSGGAGGERVIIKEEFDDGTARYTITDKASLNAALGSRGTQVGVGGVGGGLSAALGAEGALQHASIYETSTPEQTKEIDDALASSGGLEGVFRGVEDALDVPLDFVTTNLPFGMGFKASDVIDVDEFLFNQVFGDDDLPPPNSQAIGGEVAITGSANARDDKGPEEVEAGGQFRAAAGGLQYTDGPRKGEREFYYKVSGSAGAELKTELLGAGNVGASGELTVTLVLDADGRPKTLRVNGVGTATGLNDLGDPSIGVSEADLREFGIDRDVSSGKTVEFTGELDLRDPAVQDAALDILRAGPTGELPQAGLDLARVLTDRAQLEYALYDTTKREDTTKTDLIVANLSTEDTDQVDTLTSLYRKAPGGTFQKIDCNS